MKIPRHVSDLHTALDEYIRAAVDHQGYVNHNSPQSSVDQATSRFLDAVTGFRAALAICARTEGVTS